MHIISAITKNFININNIIIRINNKILFIIFIFSPAILLKSMHFIKELSMSRHKATYIITYHGILSRHVVCHDYRGIPKYQVIL